MYGARRLNSLMADAAQAMVVGQVLLEKLQTSIA
jgi:hypothetical protein